MDVRSLGFRTELQLLRLGGSQVEDRGDHLVVRTPDNPTYRWGNFLLVSRPPTADEIDGWVATSRREMPYAGHAALGIDRPGLGDLGPLRAAGWSVDAPVAMTASDVRPPARPPGHAELRPLESDDDWVQQVDLSLAGEEEHLTRDFLERRHRSYRDMVEAGAGRWWGAWVEGRLVSSMGIYRVPEADGALARFQNVKTHPDHRRQGLAGALVHAAGRDALDRMGAHELVMVAEPEDDAIRVYRAAGFVAGGAHAEATLFPLPG